MPRELRNVDSADQAQRTQLIVWLAIPLAIIGLAVGGLLAGRSLFLLFLSPVLGVALAFALREVIWFLGDRTARLVGQTLHAAGNIPYPAGYSHEEALVARGRHAEAAQSYRRHLEARPDDAPLMLRLADLTARHLGDPAEAERLYLEIRRLSPHPDRAANPLIDLYRRTGNRGRLMAELARFAAAHQDTRAGNAARRELQLLKD